MVGASIRKEEKDDPQCQDFRINPATFLDRLGICNYSINHEMKMVYLPEEDFKRLAESIGQNVVSITKLFRVFGWKWVKV